MPGRTLFVLTLLFMISSTAVSQLQLPRSVLSNSAIQADGGGYQLRATIGQVCTGHAVSQSKQVDLGFWYSMHAIPTTAHAAQSAPNIIALGQNYPNPVGADVSTHVLSTRIDFSLPESVHTTFALYDAMGRRRMLLINEYLQASRYTVEIKTGDLPPGVYIYRLTAGAKSAERKMLVVR